MLQNTGINRNKGKKDTKLDNPFEQPSVAFNIYTSHLFCTSKQMPGFYMKRNTGLKLVKVLPQEAWKYATLIKFSNDNQYL